jgi:hypothetical protein
MPFGIGFWIPGCGHDHAEGSALIPLGAELTPSSTALGWKTRRKCKKILKHLGLWDVKARPPPRKEKPPGMIET